MNQIERSRRRFNHTAIKNTADVSSKRDKNRIVYIERETDYKSNNKKCLLYFMRVGKTISFYCPSLFHTQILKKQLTKHTIFVERIVSKKIKSIKHQ